jgi:hypothetical protein
VFFKTFSCFKWCRIFMVQEVSHQPLIMEASVQSLARPCERCGEIVEQVQVFFDYFSVSLSVSFHECSWTHLSLMLIILPKHSAIKEHTQALLGIQNWMKHNQKSWYCSVFIFVPMEFY